MTRHSIWTPLLATAASTAVSLWAWAQQAYQNALIFGVLSLLSIWGLWFVSGAFSRSTLSDPASSRRISLSRPYNWGIWLILLMLFLFVPMLPRGVDEASRRQGCEAKLEWIANALRQYRKDHGVFPPAFITDRDGRPLHSWRVLLLPYLGESDLFDELRMDEPWDSPHNRRLLDQSDAHARYQCPSERWHRHARAEKESRTTTYVAVVPDAAPAAHVKEPSVASEVTVVSEIVASDIHWAEPRDVDLSSLRAEPTDVRGNAVGSRHGCGVNVAVASEDGVTWIDSGSVAEKLERLVLSGMQSGHH